MKPELITPIIAASAALGGVIISQAITILLSFFDKRHKKHILLRQKYEEMMFEFQFQTNPQFKQQILQQQLLMHQPPLQQVEPVQQVVDTNQTAALSTSVPDPTPVNNNQTKEKLAKKQEQVRQIQELDMLNKKMQQQSFQKLQQLRRIQQMKEQQEKNNEKE